MNNQALKYITQLFEELPENQQVNDLKEEIITNLNERITDYIKNGDSEEVATNMAIDDLGDMRELIDALKDPSAFKKDNKNNFDSIGKKHVVGYWLGSLVFIIGVAASIICLISLSDYRIGLNILFGTMVIVTAPLVYLGFTQETNYVYPMETKRAATYGIFSAVSLLSVFIALMLYLYEFSGFVIGFSFIALCIPSVAVLIYLGLSEKSRSKFNLMDKNWQEKWLKNYMHPRAKLRKDYLHGGIWVFATALFLIAQLNGIFYAFTIFIIASAASIIIEGYYKTKF